MKKILAAICLFMLFLPSLAESRGTAGDKAGYESFYILDMPTAGMLPVNSYFVNSQMYHLGGIKGEISASPFRHFQFGLSYSADNVIGIGTVSGQNMPGVHIKIRPFEEKREIPAIVIGFSTQGNGIFNKSDKRFETFSPGAYLALSKNFIWELGYIAMHGGIGYSLEPLPAKRKVNFWVGAEQSIGPYISANFEYNFNLDDDNTKYLSSKGTLNAAIRWSAFDNMTLQFVFRDLLENQKGIRGIKRGLGLEYVGRF